ncbi:MFS transporter [Candidatus Lokiarchaeum ossiferum]|uniref:MFS transporter n=1 Tax=Candidatus Lokiarchaeum ossiferum TaxID=2951803 RepID=UPI00352D321C
MIEISASKIPEREKKDHFSTNSDNCEINIDNNSKKYLITPDFEPMIKIIYWNSLGFFFFGFIIPWVTAQLMDASGTELGFVVASQTVGGLISSPIVGYLTDKISKKKLVLIGSTGRGFAYVIMYFGICFTSIYVFAIGIFIQGLTVGYFWTPLNALIAQKSHKTYRASAFGKQGGMIGKGNLVGSIITFSYFGLMNFLVPNQIWLIYIPLLFYMCFNVFAGLKFYHEVDEKLTFDIYIKSLKDSSLAHLIDSTEEIMVRGDKNQAEIQPSVARKGLIIGLTFLMFAFFVAAINQSLTRPFLQVFLTETMQIQNGFIVMLIYFPSEVLSQLLAPKLGEQADKLNASIGVVIISGFGALITWFLISTNSPIIFGLILIFDTTFAWGGNLIFQNLLSRVSKNNRGKVFGLQNWITLLGAVAGPILGGLLWDNFTHKTPFLMSIFIELLLIPLFLLAIYKLNPFIEEKIDKKKREI